jgi:hypothetical protein
MARRSADKSNANSRGEKRSASGEKVARIPGKAKPTPRNSPKRSPEERDERRKSLNASQLERRLERIDSKLDRINTRQEQKGVPGRVSKREERLMGRANIFQDMLNRIPRY